MRSFARTFAIICALAVALSLSACSTTRLGYNNAPTLAYWWLDGYFDFDSAQSTRIRADLQQVLDWHRKDELPLYAELLKNVRTSAAQTTTPEQVCNLYNQVLVRLQTAGDRLAPAIAGAALTLQPTQLEHIARAFEKRNREWREEWMDGSVTERTERRFDKLLSRAESFYGKLDAQQQATMRVNLTQSVWDANLSYRETLRRQQDALQTLQDIRTDSVSDTRAQAAIRALLERSINSPDPTYRKYMASFTAQSCAAIAKLHNSASPTQRTKLAQTLQDYEEDARALMAARASP